MATLLALFATSLSNRATALLMTVERSGDDNADSLGFIVRAGRGGEKTRSSSFLSLSLSLSLLLCFTFSSLSRETSNVYPPLV